MDDAVLLGLGLTMTVALKLAEERCPVPERRILAHVGIVGSVALIILGLRLDLLSNLLDFFNGTVGVVVGFGIVEVRDMLQHL